MDFSRRSGRLWAYVNASLWVVPLIAIPLAFLMSRILHSLDDTLGWDALGITLSGAQAMYQAVVSATLSFVVFTFGWLLVAIQIASGQMTPRIIAVTLLRANMPKFTVALFAFTLMFSLSALNRIGETVHQLVAFSVALLAVACFASFFLLIDYAARMLRPVSILKMVGDNGLAIVGRVYPELSRGPDVARSDGVLLTSGPNTVITHRGASGIVLSVETKAVVAQAEKADCVIEFVPQVGDFVTTDEPLYNVFGVRPVDGSVLRAAVDFGSERTMEQDPTFAFRVIIDIALKALSPAINDPTTAVLAIDQLHRMLRLTGKRHLRGDEILDRSGRPRVIFRTPNWEDFVSLTFSEIRACGSNNLQIVRRLRAMLDDLLRTLPEHRHGRVLQEASLLDREIDRHFIFPEEARLARVPDTQGLGGHSAAGQGGAVATDHVEISRSPFSKDEAISKRPETSQMRP